MDNISFTPSSGNVFLDIGFSPQEAEEMLAKSYLIMSLEDTIEKRNLTQKQAAKICGTDQPTLSKVLRGRMDSVTIDRLASWLTALGHSVEIRVTPHRRRNGARGRLVAFVDRIRKAKPSPAKKRA